MIMKPLCTFTFHNVNKLMLNITKQQLLQIFKLSIHLNDFFPYMFKQKKIGRYDKTKTFLIDCHKKRFLKTAFQRSIYPYIKKK